MFWPYVSMISLMLTGLFLIFIILLQRGRGGGLAGAFGGLGGQSAFGTKAGDVFTRITVVIAVIWVLLAGIGGFALRAGGKKFKQEKAPIAAEIDSLDQSGTPVSIDTNTPSETGTPSDSDTNGPQENGTESDASTSESSESSNNVDAAEQAESQK